MSGLVCGVVVLIIASSTLSCEVTIAAESQDEVPLMTRAASERILLVFKNEKEKDLAIQACRDYEMKFDVAASFDRTRIDYGEYHAILAGSNAMDYWRTAENKRSEAFRNIEAFVEEGGHLVLFGSFNARNMEHLAHFGVKTSGQMTSTFRPVPGTTELLFAGNETLVPSDGKIQSCGWFSVSQPHVALLKRGPGSHEGDPVAATIPFEQGRLTIMMVEPHWKDDMWVIRPLVSWIARGGPTRTEQAGRQVVMTTATGGNSTDGRDAVPPLSLRNRVAASVQQEFAREFAALGEPGAEQAFARRLLEKADSAKDDPARYFVLMDMAASHSVQAGDAETALRTVEKLGDRFQINLPSFQVAVLESAAKAARGPNAKGRIAAAGLDLLAKLVDANEYEAAQDACRMVIAAAGQSKNSHLQTLVRDRNKRVGRLRKLYEEVAPAVASLQSNPRDSEAHGAFGRFLAFEKGDWEAALVHLSKCDDPQLREAAGRDLGRPNTPEAQITLANHWRTLADQAQGSEKQAMAQRAAHWYLEVLPELSGSVRTDVLRKLATTPSAKAQLRIQIRRLVGTGNFLLDSDQIRWDHGTWSLPDGFRINDLAWDPEETNSIPNRGATRFLPEGVIVETARLVKRRGRGTATLEIEAGHVVIKLDDAPSGDDDYELLLTFGN